MLRKRIAGYLFVGGLAFVIEYVSFAAIIAILPIIVLAQSTSFGLGLVVSFLGNRYYTFKSGSGQGIYKHDAKGQAVRYLALGLFNLVCTNVLIYWQVEVLLIDPLVAKIITMAMVVVWNFIIFSRLIFKT